MEAVSRITVDGKVVYDEGDKRIEDVAREMLAILEKAELYIQALEKAVPYIQSWAVVEEVRAVIAKARGELAEYGE